MYHDVWLRFKDSDKTGAQVTNPSNISNSVRGDSHSPELSVDVA